MDCSLLFDGDCSVNVADILTATFVVKRKCPYPDKLSPFPPAPGGIVENAGFFHDFFQVGPFLFGQFLIADLKL